MSDMIKSFLPFKNKRRGTTDATATGEESQIKVNHTRRRSHGDLAESDEEWFNTERTNPDEWKELTLLKSLSPVVVCVLPSIARDFVASALLAVGANPVIPEGKCTCFTVCKKYKLIEYSWNAYMLPIKGNFYNNYVVYITILFYTY